MEGSALCYPYYQCHLHLGISISVTELVLILKSRKVQFGLVGMRLEALRGQQQGRSQPFVFGGDECFSV